MSVSVHDDKYVVLTNRLSHSLILTRCRRKEYFVSRWKDRPSLRGYDTSVLIVLGPRDTLLCGRPWPQNICGLNSTCPHLGTFRRRWSLKDDFGTELVVTKPSSFKFTHCLQIDVPFSNTLYETYCFYSCKNNAFCGTYAAYVESDLWVI